MAADGSPATEQDRATPRPVQRMRRAERREQILAAATRAFARAGFAATSLDDVAGEAGVSKVILYRHFESKTDLYRAVLDQVCTRLVEAVGLEDYTEESVRLLLRAAAGDPDGFRLLFRHATREPEFRDEMDVFRAGMADVAHRQLAARIPDPAWATWAAALTPALTVEAIAAWLDAGQPDPDQAADRILHAIHGVTEAAGPR